MADADPDIKLLDVDLTEEITGLVSRFPLPAGVKDADMNQEELAAALQQSVNTIAKWIRAGMPVAQPGRNGMPYVLRLSHCFAWMKAREAEQDLRTAHNKAQATALQAQLLGLDVDNDQAALSPKQRREMAEAELVWNRAARDRGDLVMKADVQDLLEALFRIVRDGVEAMPDLLERELHLKPEQVAAAVKIGRDILTGIADRIATEELGAMEEINMVEQG